MADALGDTDADADRLGDTLADAGRDGEGAVLAVRDGDASELAPGDLDADGDGADDADREPLGVGDALGDGDAEFSKHSAWMVSAFPVPEQGSPNKALVAGTEQLLRPMHAARTTEKELPELHVP